MYAQTVSGTVTDANGPLPVVNVTVKGTTNGTATDFNGKYSINNVAPGSVLVFTYIGYVTKEEAVTGSILNVVLAEDSQALDEVVITGYVGQKRNSISGAVSEVNIANLTRTRVADVSQALQGQVAGVFVAASTGAPGDGIQLRIRGEGTLGNNNALFVVDGVPTRDITFLSSSDVKSMTVLKDAASASIYGSRAAGGVVLITTKKGAEGKSSLDAEMFTGVHFAVNLPKMLNAEQYMNVEEMAWNNSTKNVTGATNPYTRDRNERILADTDWLDELFTTGLSTNFQLSASGGTEKTRYYISGGYFGVDGIVTEKNDKYKRVNFRTNIESEVSERFKVGSNLQLTYITQDRLSSSGDAPGVIRHALIRPPVLSVYKDVNDPTYSARNPYTDLPFYTGPDEGWSKDYEFSSNPLAIVHFTDDKRSTFQAFGNVYAEYSLLRDKSLKFRSNLGADIRFLHSKVFAENYGDANIANTSDVYYGLGRNNRPNSLNEGRGENITFSWANTLNYETTINDSHDINFLLGTELIKNKESAIGGARSNFDNTSDPYRYLDFGGVGSATLPYPYSSGREDRWSLFSFFGSGTYGYKDISRGNGASSLSAKCRRN